MTLLSEKKMERLVAVAEMYYKKNMTQSQIAKVLNISRPMVSILLSEAKEYGIVTITINYVTDGKQLVAERLKQQFQLEEVIVVKNDKTTMQTNANVAKAAYKACVDSCKRKQPINLGIGWGSMLGEMIEYADTKGERCALNGSVFPLIGGIGASYRSYHTNELVRIFAQQTGLEAIYLYLPAFFDSEAEKEAASQMLNYKEFEKTWSSIDHAVVNISSFPSSPDLGVAYRYGNSLVKNKAVGHIAAHYYSEDGSFIEAKVDNAMQASIEQLRRVKEVTALCSCLLTPQSVIGALKTGIITRLVLPYELAEKVLEA